MYKGSACALIGPGASGIRVRALGLQVVQRFRVYKPQNPKL